MDDLRIYPKDKNWDKIVKAWVKFRCTPSPNTPFSICERRPVSPHIIVTRFRTQHGMKPIGVNDKLWEYIEFESKEKMVQFLLEWS